LVTTAESGSIGGSRAFIAASSILNDRATRLGYVLTRQCGCLLCVAALAGLKDGPMLSRGLRQVAHVYLGGVDMQIVLRTVS
jgi:hypothetical protein